MKTRLLFLSLLTLVLSPSEGYTQRNLTHVPLSVSGSKNDTPPVVGREITTTFIAGRLPKDALLEVSGAIPEGISAEITRRHVVTLSGTVTLPQTCQISFRALKGKLRSKKTFRFALEFPREDRAGVYQGSIQKVSETDTYIKYEIQATNVSGLPITSATIRTFLSGAMGGIFQNDSVPLPEIPIGSSASTTIWYKKGTGLPGTAELILNGKSNSEELVSVSEKNTAVRLSRSCDYSELIRKVEP
jgi:hypothetical protein